MSMAADPVVSFQTARDAWPPGQAAPAAGAAPRAWLVRPLGFGGWRVTDRPGLQKSSGVPYVARALPGLERKSRQVGRPHARAASASAGHPGHPEP